MRRPSPLVVIEAPGKLAAARAAFRAIRTDADLFATRGVLYDLPEGEYALDGDGAPTAWACRSPDARERIRAAAAEGREVVAWTDGDDAGEWIASQVQALAPGRFARLRTWAMALTPADWEGRRGACDAEAVARQLAQRLANRAIGYAVGRDVRLHVGPAVTRALASLADAPLAPEAVELAVGPDGLARRCAAGFGRDGAANGGAAGASGARAALADAPWRPAPVEALDGPAMALAFGLARGGGVAAVWREAQDAYMRGESSYHRTGSGGLAPWQRAALDRRFEGLFRAPSPPAAAGAGDAPHGAWVPLLDPGRASQAHLVSQLCDYWLERSEGSEVRAAGEWLQRRRPRRRSPFASWRQSARPPAAAAALGDALWRRLMPLATPSGIAGLVRRARPLVDRAGRLNADGWASLRRAQAEAPGLLEPGCGERLAALQADPSASVLDRVAASVRLAGARPPAAAPGAAPAAPVWADVPLR